MEEGQETVRAQQPRARLLAALRLRLRIQPRPEAYYHGGFARVRPFGDADGGRVRRRQAARIQPDFHRYRPLHRARTQRVRRFRAWFRRV